MAARKMVALSGKRIPSGFCSQLWHIGRRHSVAYKVLVSSKEDGVKHGLVQEEVAHPLSVSLAMNPLGRAHLRDDDVELVDRKGDILELALDKLDLCLSARPRADFVTRTVLREAVGPDNLLRLVQDVGHVDTDNKLGSSLGREHGEDTGSTADLSLVPLTTVRPNEAHVEHSLALEQVRVLHDGVSVAKRSDGVLQHLLVDTCESALCIWQKGRSFSPKCA